MIAVLMYHSIDDSGSPVSLSRSTFDDHLRWLTSGRVQVVSLDAIHGIDTGPDSVAVTFDDGFVSAKPAMLRLLEQGIEPTIFVVTDHAGRTNAWGGRSQAGIPTLPLLGWDDLGDLVRRGARIEAHTRSHPRLTRITATERDDELGSCQEELRSRLGVRATHLAYPYGDVNDEVSRQTAGRFHHGHTTQFQALGRSDDAMQQPRLDMYYFQRPGGFDRWGEPSFVRRLAWIRARRMIRARLFA